MSARRELLQQLQPWREAGVLDAAEVHIASSLASRVGESRPHVVLALALAVAAPRSGHVALDPEHARESAMREAERVDDDAIATVAALASCASSTVSSISDASTTSRFPWLIG
jgi:hypothetical protein